jgi:hypothetical protein
VRNRIAIVVALFAGTTVSAAQGRDSTHWRWSVSGGPTVLMGGRITPAPNNFYVIGTDTAFVPRYEGGMHGVFNLGVGLSRLIPNTSLTFRLQGMVDRTAGVRHPLDSLGYPASFESDREVFLAGFQWDGMRSSRWSPYLVTMAGFGRRWSGFDAISPNTMLYVRDYGIVFSYGAGVRLRLKQREWFLETQRIRGPTLTWYRDFPISFGVRF